MDVKSRVFKFEEYCDVYIFSEYIPTKYFFMTKGKMVTVQWRTLADATLTK